MPLSDAGHPAETPAPVCFMACIGCDTGLTALCRQLLAHSRAGEARGLAGAKAVQPVRVPGAFPHGPSAGTCNKHGHSRPTDAHVAVWRKHAQGDDVELGQAKLLRLQAARNRTNQRLLMEGCTKHASRLDTRSFLG